MKFQSFFKVLFVIYIYKIPNKNIKIKLLERNLKWFYFLLKCLKIKQICGKILLSLNNLYPKIRIANQSGKNVETASKENWKSYET